METKTEIKEQTNTPLTTGVLLKNIILANEDIAKTKNSSIRINGDILKLWVTKATKKYPEIRKHDYSVVRMAILEMAKDSLIEEFENRI